MAKRKNNSFKGVLGVIIAICIIIVFAALIYVYLISPLLNNPDNDSPTAEPEKFTLSVNDKNYSENSTIELYSNYTVFDVYCDKEFTVEILPLDGINFDYFVAGKSCRYSEVDNLFDVFIFKNENTSTEIIIQLTIIPIIATNNNKLMII